MRSTPGTEFYTYLTEQSTDESKRVSFVCLSKQEEGQRALFSHIIRTVNFRAEPICAPHVGPEFFFFNVSHETAKM